MIKFATIPQRADFAFQTLIGPCRTSGKDLLAPRTFFGLGATKTIPFGCMRDEEGHIYAPVRSVMAPTGTPNPTKFIYQSTRLDGANLRIDHERCAGQAVTPKPKATLEGNAATWSSLPDEGGNPWRLSVSGDHIHWREDNLFDIGGPALASGFQWYLPGVDWGTFYISQLYSVSGLCEGRAVKGVIAIDQPYMAEGGAIHFQKDLVVNNNKHVIWWSFATVYKDGSYDVGSLLVGHDNLGYAILMNEKDEIKATTNVEGSVIHKPDSPFVAEVRVIIDGQDEWEYLPDAKGEMLDFVGGFPITAQQEGRWRRVGDTREPDHWMAWGESDRRNGTARNAFGPGE